MKKGELKAVVREMAWRVRPMMKFVLGLFFERKYLKGRHFDEGLSGYIWGFHSIWTRNILRLAPPCKFPASHNVTISDSDKIVFHPDDLNNFQSRGIYFQNFAGRINLGHGTFIAPNVGIITANHDLRQLDKHLEPKDVNIGDNCWIGMNSIVLPGITLGDQTIVGAGSVVTKSFPIGRCVIAGNPAKLIKKLTEENIRSL